MVEGNMGKFESWISLFKFGGEFFIECMCIFESIVETPDPLFKFNFAQGLAKDKLGVTC